MTDYAAPVFRAITGQSAAAAAPAAASASRGVALPLLGKVSVPEILAGGVGAFGALANIRAGQAAAAASETEARYETFRAGQEKTAAQQEENKIRENLLRTLAQNRAAAGASGITLDSGSVRTGIEESIAAANRELSVLRDNSEIRAASRIGRAEQLRMEARSARSGGVGRAAFGLLDAVYRGARRG